MPVAMAEQRSPGPEYPAKLGHAWAEKLEIPPQPLVPVAECSASARAREGDVIAAGIEGGIDGDEVNRAGGNEGEKGKVVGMMDPSDGAPELGFDLHSHPDLAPVHARRNGKNLALARPASITTIAPDVSSASN